MTMCKDCAHNKEARQRWGSGPWEQEPDYEAFTAYGFDCQLHRSYFSWWCGYVGLPQSHPLFQIDISDIDKLVKIDGRLWWTFWSAAHVISLPSQHDLGMWWVGFDLNLRGQAPADYGPMLRTGHLDKLWRYWTIEDCRRETRKLAQQFATIAGSRRDAARVPAIGPTSCSAECG